MAVFLFFKQKTAYEMRISDWSSDVCSSDLEFGATITFVSNIPGETRTLSVSVYSALQVPVAEASVVRLAALSVLLSLGSLNASAWLARRMTGGRSHVFCSRLGVRHLGQGEAWQISAGVRHRRGPRYPLVVW